MSTSQQPETSQTLREIAASIPEIEPEPIWLGPKTQEPPSATDFVGAMTSQLGEDSNDAKIVRDVASLLPRTGVPPSVSINDGGKVAEMEFTLDNKINVALGRRSPLLPMKLRQPRDKFRYIIAPGLAQSMRNVRKHSGGRWFEGKATALFMAFLAVFSTIICAAIIMWHK